MQAALELLPPAGLGRCSGGHGKTGGAPGYGWYVGWATRNERTLVFARPVEKDAAHATSRRDRAMP